MNRKGYTLIEIIICISLLAVISISVTIITINKKNDSKIDEINKKILDSANVYINIEKDKNGNSFISQIYKGQAGVQIPLVNLYNKGYIDDNTVKTLKDLKGSNVLKENYVLALLGDGTEGNDCNDVTLTINWSPNTTQEVYLCRENTLNSVTNIVEASEKIRIVANFDKIAVSKEFYESLSNEDRVNFTGDENGLFAYYNEETKKEFMYYRGAVDNNYVNLGKDSNGNILKWRILWYNSDKQMKLVLDTPVPIIIGDTNLYTKNIASNDISGLYKSYYYYKGSGFDYAETPSLFNPKINRIDCGSGHYETTLISNNIFDFNFNLEYLLIEGNYKNNFYKKELDNWYDLNLKDENFDFLTKENNFCVNRCLDNTPLYANGYINSNDFECRSGTYDASAGEDEKECPYTISNISEPVWFLTSGDVIRAGIKDCNGIVLSDGSNYLINDGYSYILADIIEERTTAENSGYTNYYVNNNGLKSGTFYQNKRDYYIDYQLLYDINGVQIYERFHLNSWYRKNIETFYANSIKPVIILDLTNYKLSNALGTIDNSYEIIPNS